MMEKRFKGRNVMGMGSYRYGGGRGRKGNPSHNYSEHSRTVQTLDQSSSSFMCSVRGIRQSLNVGDYVLMAVNCPSIDWIVGEVAVKTGRFVTIASLVDTHVKFSMSYCDIASEKTKFRVISKGQADFALDAKLHSMSCSWFQDGSFDEIWEAISAAT